jgi:hypothetical protein
MLSLGSRAARRRICCAGEGLEMEFLGTLVVRQPNFACRLDLSAQDFSRQDLALQSAAAQALDRALRPQVALRGQTSEALTAIDCLRRLDQAVRDQHSRPSPVLHERLHGSGVRTVTTPSSSQFHWNSLTVPITKPIWMSGRRRRLK